eukprot:m.43284 g.43284  ORF g.43284 m.43284 type:complete len:67 (+) comp8408_c0_seq1:5083-5283(+)
MHKEHPKRNSTQMELIHSEGKFSKRHALTGTVIKDDPIMASRTLKFYASILVLVDSMKSPSQKPSH